jgi:hypothetical protein
MVAQLKSDTRLLRSGGSSSCIDLSAYAVAHLQKLRGAISVRDSAGLHSQMSIGMEIALAPKDWQSIFCLVLTCNTDVKDINMQFSWIADGIFAETLGYCEAEGKSLTPEQKRAIERNVINFHRQERAKAVALVAKYPLLYGKNK